MVPAGSFVISYIDTSSINVYKRTIIVRLKDYLFQHNLVFVSFLCEAWNFVGYAVTFFIHNFSELSFVQSVSKVN